MKKRFYTELAYVLGLLLLALGTAMMTTADFGVSMVVAPAYLLHLKLSQVWSFVSFGVAEYMLQAVLLVVMMLILRKFEPRYLFAFVTTLIYGVMLDGWLLLVRLLPQLFAVRLVLYAAGMVICAAGIAMLFNTYLSPAVYELFVKEVSARFGIPLTKFKTGFDIVFCILAVMLSFALFGFGHFEGVKWGTVITALLNGTLIGACSKLYQKHFTFVNLKR